MKLQSLLATVLILAGITLHAQQLAFPGAEGYGRYATGGRNGTVYHVTNLNDSGPGSFRDAVSASNRIVVFDVGGIINISTRIVIHSNVTVAGQTAPGGGITIYGNGIALNDDSGNSIIRYIRIRMGKNGDITKDAIGVSAGQNYMFDHVSVSWGRDGTFDINGSGIDNISIQDCIISQGINLDNHSTGGLMQSGKFSIIRTLWIDNKTRNPKGRGTHDFINSVIYNWKEDGFIMGDTEGESEVNLMGNYFIAGPSSATGNYITRTTPTFSIYPSDNWLDVNKDGVLNGTELSAGNGDYKTATIMESPFSHPEVNNLLTATEAVNHIIMDAGASIVRDAVDELLINELKSMGTLGQIVNTEDDNGIEGNIGVVPDGPRPTDADNDGMPDDWEDANETDKNVNDAMLIGTGGYSNIENYINSVVAPLPFLAPPWNIHVIGSDTGSISLAWTNDEKNAGGLSIEYGISPEEFTRADTVAGNAVSAKISGLESGTTYYFRIMAYNDSLESGYSEVLPATTVYLAVPPLPCTAPSPADESSIGIFNNVILTWENTTTELGGTLYYDVYFGMSAGSMDLVSSKQLENFYVAGDLSASGTYFWRVEAKNDLGIDEGETWSFSTSAGRQKILYIPFDETSGTTAANLAGSSDATALDLTPAWEKGKRANSIYFSASPATGCMSIDHYSDLAMGTSSFTISLWFKSTGGGISDTYLIHKGTHSSDYGPLGTGKWIGIQYKAGERLTFAIDDNVTKSDMNIGSPDRYFDNTWHHIVSMRDVSADKLRMYIDGVLIQEIADNTGDISETAEFVIGNSNYNFNTPFQGNMDELQVFNDALSEEEVQYLYNSEVVSVLKMYVPPPALHAWPNPFSDVLTIENPAGITGAVHLRLIDMSGRIVRTKKIHDPANRIMLEGLAGLPAGVYSVMLLDGSNRVYISRLVKN